jgi:hypothetical protein
VWETSVVFHLTCESQLTERKRTAHPIFLSYGTFVDKRLQLRSGGVGGSRPTGWTTADDDELFIRCTHKIFPQTASWNRRVRNEKAMMYYTLKPGRETR